MTREFPMVSQFRPDSPSCDGRSNACAVATTEALLRRYRPLDPVPRQRDLGQLMGHRHRLVAQDPPSKHGQCPSAWCPFCSYLELKARHVPVAYGRLSVSQLRAHLRLRHAVHMGGWYAAIHQVSATSYDRDTPALGRSDRSLNGEFQHSMVVWEVGKTRPDGRPRTYIVSDPDFGSGARPAMPPFCEYDAGEVEGMYTRGGLRIAYCLTAPPSLDRKLFKIPHGVTLRFGAVPRGRGRFVVTTGGANQRSSPFVRPGNVLRKVPAGTEFTVLQTALAGTNVRGSSKWRGDATGTIWMHDSVVEPAG